MTDKLLVWNGRSYSYFRHAYNNTGSNERAIEVPIALGYLDQAKDKKILEIGNVLSHYMDEFDHLVIDKHERAPGVMNVDIQDYSSKAQFDLIVSVSTLEHVGWDEHKYGPGSKRDRDPEKLGRVLEKIRAMLAKGGTFVTTMPIGYNPGMDERLSDGRIRCDEMYWFERTGMTEWRESTPETVLKTRYGNPHPNANGLFIGIDHAADC